MQYQECAAKLGMNEEHVGPASKDDKTARANDCTVHDPQGAFRSSIWDRLASHIPQVCVCV